MRGAPKLKLRALLSAAESLDNGQPVRQPVASWLSDAFRHYVATEGASLDDALLLRPRQGKPSPWSEYRAAVIAELLVKLSEHLGGGWRSAKIISKMLVGEEFAPPGEPGLWLLRLASLHAPASPSRIWEIVRSHSRES